MRETVNDARIAQRLQENVCVCVCDEYNYPLPPPVFIQLNELVLLLLLLHVFLVAPEFSLLFFLFHFLLLNGHGQKKESLEQQLFPLAG